MSDDAFHVDPDVRALLDEVISDPSSVLMRPPKQRLSRVLGISDAPISPQSPFLSNVEKLLLERHREELAALLLDASKAQLLAVQRRGACMHAQTDPLDKAGRERRIEALRKRDRGLDLDQLDGLQAESSKATGTALAAASLRAVPRDATRITYALHLKDGAQPDLALGLLEDVLSKKSDVEIRALALANYAFIAADLGRREQAREFYREASLASWTRPACLLHWLVFALRSGHRTEVEHADALIGQRVPTDHSDVEDVAAALIENLKDGDWKQSRETPRLIALMKDRGSYVTRRIANVIPSST